MQKNIEQNNVMETEVDVDKVFSLPKDIKVVKYESYYLVIYTKGVLWLVLNNKEELDVFKELLCKKSIKYVLNKYSEDSVINVITQIEAKSFEKPVINKNNEKTVYIYLTNNCNLRCKHCYMYAGDLRIKELPYSKWIDILKNLKDAGYEGVTFTGGEVTVYDGYEKLICYAHDIGLFVTVLSNGILWTSKLISKLSKYIDEIQISIDGYDDKSYYDVRCYHGFEKALSCIEEFYKSGTRVSMAVTPLYNRLDEFVEKFEPFARGVLKKYPNLFIKLNHELIDGREIKVTEDRNREYKNKLKALVERLYPNYYTETFVLNYNNKQIRENCGFGGISIAANGDVYWCNRIHELESKINILNCNVQDITRLGNKVKQITSVDNTRGCKDCEIRYICGGGCRMKYEGIKDLSNHVGDWNYKCEGKEQIYKKMVLSNEYFYEE